MDIINVLRSLNDVVGGLNLIDILTSDSILNLLSELAESDIRLAESHLRSIKRATAEDVKRMEFMFAADKYKSAADKYLIIYRKEKKQFWGRIGARLWDGNETRILDALRATILCYLHATLCYKAVGERRLAEDGMAKAGKIFYGPYVTTKEFYMVGDTPTGYSYSHKSFVLQSLSEEEKEFIRFCTLNGKERWGRVCQYDSFTKKVFVMKSLQASAYEDENFFRKAGGNPPAWIQNANLGGQL